MGFFLACDNLLFRTGLYASMSYPRGLVNLLFYRVKFENERPRSGKAEVFLMGNSRIQFAFPIGEFELRNPHAPIQFIDGTAAGTREKAWYYLLQAVDPHHNRYAAIVLTLNNYRADTYDPDEENDIDGAQGVIPILSPGEWRGFIASFTNAEARKLLQRKFLFASHLYGQDMQDLLLHPLQRYRQLKDLYAKKARAQCGPIPRDAQGHVHYSGPWNSLAGFHYDPKTGKTAGVPAGMPRGASTGFLDFFRPLDEKTAEKNVARNGAYQARWLGKIAALYKDSPTKLIFVQMPREPMHLPRREVLPSSQDVRNVLPARKNILFIDEHEFESLEKPEYFYDGDHINLDGSDAFVSRFGAAILRAMNLPGNGPK